MYTAGEIGEDSAGGWYIEIFDPEGVAIATLREGHEGMRYNKYVEDSIKEAASTLLSHLNRA